MLKMRRAIVGSLSKVRATETIKTFNVFSRGNSEYNDRGSFQFDYVARCIMSGYYPQISKVIV